MATNPLQTKVYKTIETINRLQRQRQNDWVTWQQVAKVQEGSEALAEELSGWASLPEYRGLFAQDRHNRKVCLTPEGILALHSSAPKPQSEMEKIAAIIKKYAGQLRRLQFEIESIVPIGNSQRRIVHAVRVELSDAVVPNDAPVVIVPEKGGVWVNGRVVGQDANNGTLFLALESRCRGDLLPARLEVDRAFLLNQLATSLGKLETFPPLGRSLTEPDPKAIFPIRGEDSAVVAESLASLKPPWTRFLWGPPGAGKTYGLARLMLRLIERHPDERILLVSPSNLAVDVAFLQFINQLETHPLRHLLEERRLLRFGYPRKTEILSQSPLLGSAEHEAVSQQIAKKGKEVRDAAAQELPEEDQAILRAELLDLQEQLKKLVVDHVNSCQIVATTTAQAYSPHSPITAQQWDTVLVDEVTMVPPAICLYLSSLASKRLLLAGDPRQLGPIFEARGDTAREVEIWIGRDVFDFARLSSGGGRERQIRTDDYRLARITSQRRCTRDIWQPIANLYTEVASKVDEVRRWPLRQVDPGNGRGLVLVDVGRERPEARCELMQKSWGNQGTAALAVEIVQQLTSQFEAGTISSVAIITPYRAQYRLIKQLLREHNLKQKVEVGTIHQFQGSEADVVIFDMVDGPGRSKPGQLLVGDTGLRLVNVAISRARGKFIMLADQQWCRSTMRRGENPLLWDVVVGKTAVRLQQPTTAEHPKTLRKSEKEKPQIQSDPPTKSTTTKVAEHPLPLHKSEKAKPQTQPDRPTSFTSTEPLALKVNFTPEKIWAMGEGDGYLIPNTNVKRRLRRVLSQGGLFDQYDADRRISICEGRGKRYRIDHDKKLIICEH